MLNLCLASSIFHESARKVENTVSFKCAITKKNTIFLALSQIASKSELFNGLRGSQKVLQSHFFELHIIYEKENIISNKIYRMCRKPPSFSYGECQNKP